MDQRCSTLAKAPDGHDCVRGPVRGDLQAFMAYLNFQADEAAAKSCDNSILKAAKLGNAAAVRHFLHRQLDVHKIDSSGWTPLHHAADRGHAEVAKLLLERNAAFNVKSNSGQTPMDLAKENRHFDVVAVLENVACSH
eukprot:Skav201957  [mRNA]  locus=scaffold103:106419:116123:- [translate_table: standard]